MEKPGIKSSRTGPAVLTVAIFAILPAFAATGSLAFPERSSARPATCFGNKINRVVSGSKQTVRLKYRDVVWIAGDRVKVVAKPYPVVCADRGRQTVVAGKGRSRISTGGDADRIILHPSSNRNIVRAGLGNDYIRGAAGHDFIYASPKRVGPGETDRDTVHGLGGNDRIYDWGGTGNRLHGDNGSDRLHSLGNAVSTVYGGDGSDFLHTTGGRSGSRVERLFGERGNDRLRGDAGTTNGPAFLDGGNGDDWIYGTDRDDTIITQSGITKIDARGGDDLILTSSRGAPRINGGSGRDTVSYASHTPPNGGQDGVTIDLAAGAARGMFKRAPWHRLEGIENAEGSPFRDVLTGSGNTVNLLEGGLGDDRLQGNPGDGDRGDGGLGVNECSGFAETKKCNSASPGRPDGHEPVVDATRAGVLTVLGSRFADAATVRYAAGAYGIALNRPAVASGVCEIAGTDRSAVNCPVPATNLNGVVIHGDDGDDAITIAGSVPPNVTTSINGGSGRNVLAGGRTKDYLETAAGSSAGSILKGRGNSDLIYVMDDVTAEGGSGSDVIHGRNVCHGGRVSGGPEKDNLVFAGAPRGVDANLARGTARWKRGSCRRPLRISHDIESLEGSKHGDRLTIGRRFPRQQGKNSLLGRHGIDILDSRNGRRDTVTTGAGGRRNRVISDRADRVIWGWGLAGY